MKKIVMKKKGFTLIEIIGVIIILGVILLITIPSVNNVINDSYMQAYDIDLKSIEEATKQYILKENVTLLSGVQTRIELNDMINAGLIDEIVDPDTKEICNGYATVTDNAGDYIIHSYLKCGDAYETENYNKTDFVLPTITLSGDNPLTMNVGETYKEPGMLASDDIDGDITSRVAITGNINPNLPGTYKITYNVADNAGNDAIPVERTITVVDNEAPTISFEPIEIITYVKNGSTIVKVRDNASVNASSLKYVWTTSTTQPSIASFATSFTSGGTISSLAGATGDYYLWILAKDTSGNQAITRSNVFKLDNTGPVITITGTNPTVIDAKSVYSDAGATATDAHSGLNGSVTSSGTVNTNIVGTYSITYSAHDKSSPANCSTAVRTVIVQDIYAPVITMLGVTPITISAGSVYSDAGVTALDNVDGDVTSKVVTTGTVNPSVLGTYTITYTVKDNSNNTAIMTRTVTVIDTTLPTAAFGTNGNGTYAKSYSTTVTISDNIAVNTSSLKYQWTTSTTAPTEASFSTTFTNGGTISSPAGVTGGYYLWILAKDTSGNTLIVRTYGFWLDNTAPSVPTSELRYGSSAGTIRANSDTSWTTQLLWWGNFSATDAASGINSYQYSTGCTGTLSGTLASSHSYNNNNNDFCIRAIDNAGNTSAWGTVTYIRADNTAPSVPTSEVRYLNSAGTIRANSDTSWSKQTIWWGNFSATDATSGVNSYQYSTSCTGTLSGTLASSHSYVNNSYNFCIRSLDNAGNTSAWGAVTYIRADTTAPVITMTGSSPVIVNKGSTYSDAGATATDNLSGLNGTVTSTGSVNPNVVGTYTITYNVSDNAGNAATAVTRTITVRDVLAPVLTITGTNPISIDAGTAYSDAGATATDDVDGNVTSRITVTSNVNPNLGGTYTVTYTVKDTANNTATAVRTVYVYVTWYQSRSISSATYYGDYSATGDTTYSCPSGYTPSGSGSGMTCSKITTAANIPNTTYSCPSGYTPSGSGSTMTCSTTSTVAASGTAATVGCPSGWNMSSADNCYQNLADPTTSYSCSSGTLEGTQCKTSDLSSPTCSSGTFVSGTGCSHHTSYSTSSSCDSACSSACASSAGNPPWICTTYSTPSCSSGYSLNSSTTWCYKYVYTAATATTSCASGTYVESVGRCRIYTSSRTYSCSSGSLVGTTCYSCSSGTLSGTSCTVTSTAANLANTTYSCPSGYTPSGSGSSMTCSKTDTASNISNTSYSCPFGGSLSGTTCIRGYYQCSSGSLSGSTCYGSWSAWTTTPSTPSSTLGVQTEKRLSSV